MVMIMIMIFNAVNRLDYVTRLETMLKLVCAMLCSVVLRLCYAMLVQCNVMLMLIVCM